MLSEAEEKRDQYQLDRVNRRASQFTGGAPQVRHVSSNRHASVMYKSPSAWNFASSFELWEEQDPSFREVVKTPSHSRFSISQDSQGEAAGEGYGRSQSNSANTFKRSVATIIRLQNYGSELNLHQQKTFESTTSLSKTEMDENAIKDIIHVRRKTPYELVDQHYDDLPMLEIRKAAMRVWQGARQLCKVITLHVSFQTFIIIAILINTILLALEDPTLNTQPEPYHTMEIVLLYIYTCEMMLKIISMGFVLQRDTYLRDAWNVMDFLVVVTGWMELYSNGSGVNLSALRALRILRPLRSITRIKGMRLVFASLMSSARVLLSSMTLLLFFYLIASIACLQMFMGVLKFRCMDLDSGALPSSYDDGEVCGSRVCRSDQVCIKGLDNINYGKSNFDNLILAMLTIFQSVTLEGWTAVLVGLEKGFGLPAAAFYVPIIFLGAFFFNNMTLVAMKSAVHSTQFTATLEEVNAKMKKHAQGIMTEEEDEESSISTLSMKVAPDPMDTPPSGSKHSHSRSMFATLKEYMKRLPPLPVRAAPNYIHSRSFASDEQLVSRGDLSLTSRDPVENLGVPPSPLDTVGGDLPRCLSVASDDLPLTFRNKGSEILREEPHFPDEEKSPECRLQVSPVPNTNLVTTPFEEEQMSFTPSGFNPAQENSTSGMTIEQQLSKAAFFKQKLAKARLKREKRVACSINENWVLPNSSQADVLGPVEAKGKPPLLGPYTGGFQYSEECTLDDSGEKLSTFAPRKKSRQFQRFLKRSLVVTTKESYKELLPVARYTVLSQMMSATQTTDEQQAVVVGHWSGYEVKPEDEEDQNIARWNHFRHILWKKGCCGAVQKLCSPFKNLVQNAKFNLFMTLCVVMNTVVLAINHYQIDPDTLSVLDNLNLSFTVLFTIEMCLKLLGLGFLGYFSSKMNVFDCIVVCFSLLELSFLSGSGLSALRAIRVFRVFRVLRVARLFRYMRYMQTLLRAIDKSLSNLLYMGLLIFLFLIVSTLFGMQLFGGKFKFADGQPRANYDNFFYSFLSSFQLLTMENWFEVLYSGMRTNLSYYAAIYFVIWVFFGNFVLLNLFLAIMLNAFSEEPDDEIEREAQNLLDSSADSTYSRQSTLNFRGAKKRKLNNILKMVEAIKQEDSLASASASISADTIMGKQKTLFVENECVRSWKVFDKSSRVRIWCYRFTSSTRFEWFILLLIVLSSIKLIWETYLLDEPEGSTRLKVSENIDFIFTALFTAEFVLKSVSLGFVMGRGTYLRDCWNILDFLIVIVSLIDTSMTDINLPIIKIFRLLRALRPLRFISHNESMRIIVNALLESIGALANVAFVVLIVLLIFAILGVTLMAGKMYSCSNPAIETEAECVYYGYNWANAPYNYDNVVSAYLALFDLTSQENWPDQMYQGMDTSEPGKAMRKNCNPYMAFFFLIFVIIGNMFFLNLLLGVMFDKFEKAKRNNSSISALLLKNEQLRWVELMKFIIRTKRVKEKVASSSPTRAFALKVVSHWSFGTFIMFCIIGNMVIMAIAYDQASSSYTKALENINLVFTVIFALEACIKVYAMTVRGYFKDRWNRFDFFLSVTPLVDLTLSLTVFKSGSNKMLTVGPQLARVLRILRVSRLLRLVKKLKMIDDLVGMLSLSLPAIGNVFMLLLLVFMIFGVLGVFLFHSVQDGIMINSYNNFDNFGKAVLILIRISTGEDWNYILKDLSANSDPFIATLYVLSFVSLTTFIMYNMFIMVMLQEYESYSNNPESTFKLYKDHLATFNQAWNKCLDGDNQMRIDAERLIEFAKITGLITVEEGNTKYELKQKLGKAGFITDEQGFIYYHEALFRYFRFKCGVLKRPTNKVHQRLLEKEEQFHAKKIRKLVKVDKISSVARFVNHNEESRGEMRLFDLIFLKSVFKSWQRYSRHKKLRTGTEVSETPPMSLNDPGANTPRSVFEDEEEPSPQKEKTIPTLSGLTTARTELKRDLRVSRMSTNFSKNRVDTQE